jgi:ABC-2 type transport system ATP-binding protein
VAPIAGGPAGFREVLRAIEDAGIDLYDVGLRRPTLDDVFLTLTGHAAEQAPESDDAEVIS